jgi:hypothetical protein
MRVSVSAGRCQADEIERGPVIPGGGGAPVQPLIGERVVPSGCRLPCLLGGV